MEVSWRRVELNLAPRSALRLTTAGDEVDHGWPRSALRLAAGAPPAALAALWAGWPPPPPAAPCGNREFWADVPHRNRDHRPTVRCVVYIHPFPTTSRLYFLPTLTPSC